MADLHRTLNAAATPSPGPAAAEPVLRVFAAAWAGFTLVHVALVYWAWLQLTDITQLVLHAGLGVSAVATLLRPDRLLRLMAVAGFSFTIEFLSMPYLANHLFVTMYIDAVILAMGLAALLWRGSSLSSGERLGRVLLPVLRSILLVLYFWVVVHKLNRDYFNPVVSCGWMLYEEMARHVNGIVGFAAMPIMDWMRWPSLLAALAFELLIPVLLVIPRTRRFGIALGIVFHTMLAVHDNLFIGSFTCMMLALYAAFLPTGVASRLAAFWPSRARSRRGVLLRWGVPVAAGAVVSAVVVGVAAWQSTLDREGVIAALHAVAPPTAKLLFFAWMGLAAVLVGRTWGEWSRQPVRVAGLSLLKPSPAYAAAWLVPLVFFANALSPYLGLKNHTALAMFSNLRTEMMVNNHLFLPLVRVAPYLDEDVVVLDASGLEYQIPADGLRMTVYDVRVMLAASGQPDDFVLVAGEGGPELFSRQTTPDARFFDAPPAVVAKFFGSKAIPPDDEPCPCRH